MLCVPQPCPWRGGKGSREPGRARGADTSRRMVCSTRGVCPTGDWSHAGESTWQPCRAQCPAVPAGSRDSGEYFHSSRSGVVGICKTLTQTSESSKEVFKVRFGQ